MLRKTVSGIMLFLLLVSTLTLAFNIQLAQSDYVWSETIYIHADGSITPAEAPLFTVDNATYTFTDNIVGDVPEHSSAIIIERDNIVLDGAGYTLQGTEAYRSEGINLSGRTNVTVRNTQIENFFYGIWLASSSNNTISGNNITENNGWGIDLSEASYNSISGNNIANNNGGIGLGSSSSNNTISGNSIANNDPGIFIGSSSYNSISGNNITENNYNGIVLGGSSSYNSISGNNITENNGWGIGWGIDLSEASYNSISGNNIANNDYGIWLASSSNNTISGNTFTNDGLYVYDSYQNVVEGNTVNGKPLVYLEGVADCSVGDAGQVILVRCDSIRIESLNLSQTSVGVQLLETNNTIISGNNIANNDYGIVLGGSSSYNSISGNNITENNGWGIGLHSSSYNSISGNNIANNDYGIWLASSSNNTIISGNNITENNNFGIWLGLSSSNNRIYLNNFINNTPNAYSDTTGSSNMWNCPQPMSYKYNGSEYVNYLGNYWSDYSGTDIDNDGVGDTSHNINSESDHYPLMQPVETYFQLSSTTESTLLEIASSTHALMETVICQNVTLNTSVTGDFNTVLNFTDLELVLITSGAFAGKGFSRGNWTTNIMGNPYEGSWQGMLFRKLGERKIYLKGMVSGGLKGIVEGFLSESVNGSEVYDQYHATWTISHLGTNIVFAKLNLNGTVNYEETAEYSSELQALQAIIQGQASGYYDGFLNVVLTHVRIGNETNPYYGQGFSIISYVAEYGSGEGWTCDKNVTPNIVEMNGLFTDPLIGMISGKLDESGSSRTLSISIERINIGLPPTADLKVRVWGPERVSPGQAFDYIIEYRNEGLKALEFVRIIDNLPSQVEYLSSGEGIYKALPHQVVWYMENIPPRSIGYLAIKAKTSWGLPQGTSIEHSILVPREPEYTINPNLTIFLENLEFAENSIKGNVTIPEFGENGTIPMEMRFKSTDDYIIPTSEVKAKNGGYEYTYKFTEKGSLIGFTITFFLRACAARAIATWPFELQNALLRAYSRLTTLETAYTSGYLQDEDYNFLKNMHLQITEDSQHLILFKWALRLLDKAIPGEYMEKFGRWIARTGIGEAFGEFLIDVDALWWDTLSKSVEYSYQLKVREIYFEQLKKAGIVHDTSFQTSNVTVACDPNIKYGPEGYVSLEKKLDYKVEYENEGEGIAFGVYFTDTLDEDLDDSTLEIGPVISTVNGSILAGPGIYDASTRTISWFVGEVGPGEGGYANFSAQVRNDALEYAEIINYATVYFPSVPEATRTNGIVSVLGQPNIATTNITSSEYVIEKGSTQAINVTVANQGYYPETFNLTLYANTTATQTQNITLLGREINIVTFLWNTTNFAKGNYIISAYASPVIHETDTSDNMFVNGIVEVVGVCDFELQLSAGWNMVSFPCLPEDSSFSNIFSSVSYYQVLTWDGTSYVTPSTAEAGRGYWVLVLENCTVTITDGVPVESYERDVPAGWSMVGSIIICTVNATCVFPDYYQLLTWDGTGYVPSTTIETGKGYWALVLDSTHIVVDESCCLPS